MYTCRSERGKDSLAIAAFEGSVPTQQVQKVPVIAAADTSHCGWEVCTVDRRTALPRYASGESVPWPGRAAPGCRRSEGTHIRGTAGRCEAQGCPQSASGLSWGRTGQQVRLRAGLAKLWPCHLRRRTEHVARPGRLHSLLLTSLHFATSGGPNNVIMTHGYDRSRPAQAD